ncbi:hypothetical protein AC057_02125 [Acinetobacter genomosp. 33YU]|uniref:hypothetical protein n=1 Tax=Acinetobacter genomosp. 33YU TaxID=1675530 RepID=UPI00097F7A8A|nr:hypothetical protein [Acinetobacter genomosp. 33YU]ONN58742.1 hypothetical protein AC057_02125 [Acinetobacter genomosp. 33YU]
MGFFSWLFGGGKQKIENKVSKPKITKKPYGFDERRASNKKDLDKYRSSSLNIKKVKIVVDKQDLDACSTIKRMKKVHNINEVPLVPLDQEKCKHCTCYYEPILPRN